MSGRAGFIAACFIAGILSLTDATASNSRNWTGRDGNPVGEAKILDESEVNIILERPDGTRLALRKSDLSESDLLYLERNPFGDQGRDYINQRFIDALRDNARIAGGNGGEDAFLETFRLASGIFSDDLKPPNLATLLILFGFVAYGITGIWLIVSFFRISGLLGIGFIALNVIASFFPIAEILRWIFMIVVSGRNWDLTRTPFVLHCLAALAILAGLLLFPAYLIPNVPAG